MTTQIISRASVEAAWIYSRYFRAPKRVRRETRTGGRGRGIKFKGRLTDIMSICHLAPRTIKGPCEWSLLLEERAACHCWFLAVVDKLSRAWATRVRPLNQRASERGVARCTFARRSSSSSWLLFSVLICCIHVLTMQKMQRRAMVPFWET